MVEFPFVLRETGLIAEHIAQYEGEFLEDESMEQVSGVAALMVYNPGSRGVLHATLEIQQEGKTLTFEIGYLPAHSRVLVLEKNAAAYSRQDVQSCLCLSITRETFGVQGESFALREQDGALVLENISQEVKTGVALIYKQYAAKGKFYLGGAEKYCSIGTLQPGEQVTVMPYGYVPEYSHVLAVTDGE